MWNGVVYDRAKELEFQMQIAYKLFPEYPIRSLAETYYQLKKCLGIQTSTFHSIDVSERDYRTHKFIVAIDTERVLNAGFTGLNTKSGDLMTIRSKSLSATLADHPTRMQIVLHADMILNIRDTGVEVFE